MFSLFTHTHRVINSLFLGCNLDPSPRSKKILSLCSLSHFFYILTQIILRVLTSFFTGWKCECIKTKSVKTVEDTDPWVLLLTFTQHPKHLYKCPSLRYSRKIVWAIARVVYLSKWLLRQGKVNLVCLPGDNPIFCKNEGCSRIGSPDEGLQLDKERVPLLRSVTGEHHITHQAWGIKPRTVQASESWLGLQAHTNVGPYSLPDYPF